MTEGADQSGVARILGVLHRAEDTALAMLLGTMVFLAPLQIFLRNFFDMAIPWADPLLRVLVLWVGLLGAVAATRGDRQISIDVLSHLIGDKAKAGVRVATSLFAAVASAVVAYASWQFVATEFEYESIAFAGVSAWMTEIVVPYSFAVIAIRYLIDGAGNLLIVAGRREIPE